MLQTNIIFLSNIDKKGMLKSEKPRHNLKDSQGSAMNLQCDHAHHIRSITSK